MTSSTLSYLLLLLHLFEAQLKKSPQSSPSRTCRRENDCSARVECCCLSKSYPDWGHAVGNVSEAMPCGLVLLVGFMMCTAMSLIASQPCMIIASGRPALIR